jgi:enamine deaminase RidA (YjgF/YER057c/UK114 family)
MTKIIAVTVASLLCVTMQAQEVDKRLKELGIVLPQNARPIANYVSVVRTGNLLFLAGKGPLKSTGVYISGKVGKDLTIEQAYDAARLTGILQLAAIKEAIGNLDKVKRIIKVLGMVNCNADFTEHPKVINGFSDLMVEVFGEKGKHARSSVGMSSLPNNMAVEIELIVEIDD